VGNLTEFECGWLSAAIDGEGTIGMYKRQNRKQFKMTYSLGIRRNIHGDYIPNEYSYGFTVEIDNTVFNFVSYAREICGGGSEVRPRTDQRYQRGGNRKDLWRWFMTVDQVRTIFPQLTLINKKVQAEYALLFVSLYGHLSHTPIDEEEKMYLDAAWEEMLMLNMRGVGMNIKVPDIEAPRVPDEAKEVKRRAPEQEVSAQ